MHELKMAAKVKAQECAIQNRAFTLWLRTLTPFNLLLVVGAALLSLVAGSAILIEQNYIPKNIAGILALISAAMTIIHTDVVK